MNIQIIKLCLISGIIKDYTIEFNYSEINTINDDNMGESCYFLENIGKNVFLPRKVAEAKLKEMEGNND